MYTADALDNPWVVKNNINSQRKQIAKQALAVMATFVRALCRARAFKAAHFHLRNLNITL